MLIYSFKIVRIIRPKAHKSINAAVYNYAGNTNITYFFDRAIENGNILKSLSGDDDSTKWQWIKKVIDYVFKIEQLIISPMVINV